MARYKRRRKTCLDKAECILLVIVGLLLGTVFTVGMGYWNAAVAPEEALSVTAEYAGYEIEYGSRRRGMGGNRMGEVDLLFADHEPLTIDGSCVGNELLDALAAVNRGATLDLLVHPHSDSVLSITIGGQTLLAFDDAMNRLSVERMGFLALGICNYIAAGLGAYYLITGTYRKYY